MPVPVTVKHKGGQNITFELDDDLPFGTIEKIMDNCIDYTGMTTGNLRCSPERWQREVTAAAIITPIEYKNNWGDIASLPSTQVIKILGKINEMYPIKDFIKLRMTSISGVEAAEAVEEVQDQLTERMRKGSRSLSSGQRKSRERKNNG